MNKQFEEWLKNYSPMYRFYVDGYSWDKLPFSMQWGAYLEFFDSVGISIEVHHYPSYDWCFFIYNPTLHTQGKLLKTRTEAQQEAIKKAFEILNK